MFKDIAELVTLAEEQHQPISQIMIQTEMNTSLLPESVVLRQMSENWQVMKAAAKRGLTGLVSHSGMTGEDARRMDQYIKAEKGLTDGFFLSAIAYALAVNEVNAAMGLVCATPTAGSCGVVSGVLLAAQERLDKSDEQMVKALFAAGAIGYVIANNAVISGAAGGCQAEVGAASAMAAAALTELAGGSPRQCAQAMAMALKNMLGLVCDPLAGLVEVPCIKRNAGGAAGAIAAAEMALAGINSQVPADEVISAMYQIGIGMPSSLRETAQGGLAATPTGQEWKNKLWTAQPDMTE